MSKFAERVRAFNLGMSFQDEYAREISVFKSDVLHRLSSGEKLTPSQVEVLLTIEPILINQKLTEWIKAVISSKERQRGLLSDYRISEAYMRQRTWPDGQWRIYGEVLDMYTLPKSSILQDPAQVSERSVAAIRTRISQLGTTRSSAQMLPAAASPSTGRILPLSGIFDHLLNSSGDLVPN